MPILIVTLIMNTAPLFTAVLGFAFLGEKISRVEVACLIMAFGGVYTLLSSGKEDEGHSETKSSNV